MPDTSVQVGRIALTKTQLAALEATLYSMADIIDRLKQDGVQYTKIAAPADQAAQLQTGGQ